MIVVSHFYNFSFFCSIARSPPSQATSGSRLIPHAYTNVSFLANLFRMVFLFTWLTRQLVRFPSTCKKTQPPVRSLRKKRQQGAVAPLR